MNLAQRLSAYAHQLRYADLSTTVIREAKKRIIDSIGVGISAFHSRPGKITRNIAESGMGTSTVLGTRLKTSAPLAGFANGSLIRYWDYNDTYLSKEPAHPSDNFGALLAVVEQEKKSGKDLITALVLAYEIQCRLCDAASLRVRGWDHVTYGAFSVALGAGKLMGLSERELEHALGLSGIASIALRQTRVGEISDWKAPAFANAARNAVFACQLAKLGMTGPAPIFEGEKGFERLVSGPIQLKKLGGGKIPFKILETYIKFYPVEYHAQAAVEAALRLRPRIRNIHHIKKIDVDTYDVAIEIIVKDPEKWKPKSRETADHSLPYVVARSLLDGKLTLAEYADKKIHDPNVLALMRKMKVTENKKMTQQYPRLLPCRIRVYENGGDVLEELVEIPRGHYKNPMTEEEINQKFIRLTDPHFTAAQQRRVLDQIWHLESLKRWDSLMNSLVVTS